MQHEWVVADMEGNLLTLRQVPDQTRLETTGEFRLGEVVNKIVPLSSSPAPARDDSQYRYSQAHDHVDGDEVTATRKLPPKIPRTGPVVTPRAFLATIEGSIYMLGTINPAYVNVLLLLQSALASRVSAPGYMPWSKFRAWRTEVVEKDEPFRVVDGEMLEQALTQLSDDELERVLSEGGLLGDRENVSVQEVRGWGEELRRLY